MSHSSSPYAPPSPTAQGSRPYVVAGFLCAVVAVFFLPIVLGPIAVVLGFLAHRKGDRTGRWVMVAGVLGTVLGFVLGALVFAQTTDSTALHALGAVAQTR